MLKKILFDEISKLNISLSEYQAEQFICYFDLLIQWNKVMNLTGITEYKEVVQKHFIDSLSIMKAFDQEYFHEGTSMIDIGTGAGFPGIPLKIAFPNLKITLLDSLNKRINFLNEVISSLSLDNIEAVHGRAEDFSKQPEYREKFNFVVSRAVSNLSTLSEYCLPFVKVDGYFVSYKSEKADEELKMANNAIVTLGGKFEDKKDFDLYGNFRNLIIIKKVNSTPSKFPRKPGLALKKPL